MAPRVGFFRMVSEVRDGELLLPYRIEPGVDRSHGVEVARMCGVPPEVLESALAWQAIRGGTAADFESVASGGGGAD